MAAKICLVTKQGIDILLTSSSIISLEQSSKVQERKCDLEESVGFFSLA